MRDRAEEQYLAGLAQREAENFDLARHYFDQAIRANPAHAKARGEFARMLFADGQIELANDQLDRAIELSPDDDDLAISRAAFLQADRQTTRALEIVDRLLDAGNESSRLAILYARIAPAIGSETKALNFIARVLNDGRSRLPRENASLYFSAASLLDGLGRYDEAFERASIANKLRGVSYDPRQVERPIREWIEYFSPPTLRRLPHATHGSELPVFIVGMPRSGTTLVEQVLSSHPEIHGAGELRWLFQICQSLVRRGPASLRTLSDSFDRLTIGDVEALADEYLHPLQALNPQATRIINKLPTNFMHLGMVKLLFPVAKVIYCRRDAQDTCLSCHMTDFAGGNDFSAALPSLGHYYRYHEKMMDHWKSVLHLSILDVRYEDMVNDLDGQTRRMLEFLDVPWNEACLRFHENKRFVATASNEQVRRPIYRTSVGRWRNYDRHLAPLREALSSIHASRTAYSAQMRSMIEGL